MEAAHNRLSRRPDLFHQYAHFVRVGGRLPTGSSESSIAVKGTTGTPNVPDLVASYCLATGRPEFLSTKLAWFGPDGNTPPVWSQARASVKARRVVC